MRAPIVPTRSVKSWIVQKWMFGVSYQGRARLRRHRHMAAESDLRPYAPMAEIREGDDGAPSDPQHVFEHMTRPPRRLQRLRQDHVIE